VVGRRGSGKLKIEGGFKLTGRLKADLTGLRYDGNIPGLDNTDLKFHGETAFDPFLLGGAKATATAEIPETMLPPIPLPGGLTGQLISTIAKGSTVSVDFSGVCAGVADGKVQYLGQTSASGALKLKAKIVVRIPIRGDQSFETSEIPVQFPAGAHTLDLGTLPVSGTGAPLSGDPAATAMSGSCSGG